MQTHRQLCREVITVLKMPDIETLGSSLGNPARPLRFHPGDHVGLRLDGLPLLMLHGDRASVAQITQRDFAGAEIHLPRFFLQVGEVTFGNGAVVGFERAAYFLAPDIHATIVTARWPILVKTFADFLEKGFLLLSGLHVLKAWWIKSVDNGILRRLKNCRISR
jgi:hypothetical protein